MLPGLSPFLGALSLIAHNDLLPGFHIVTAPSTVTNFLEAQLQAHLLETAPTAWDWLTELKHSSSAKFKTAFSLAPRKIARVEFPLSSEASEVATSLNPAWRPRTWTLDQAARTLLLLWHAQTVKPEDFENDLALLFQTGELRELVCLYQALQFLPHPVVYPHHAEEGIRTNMRPVFIALAHHNTYPAEQLEENFFNQLILKAIFMGVSIMPIHNLSQRVNPALTAMLCDFARERWAAHRMVPAELWYPVSLSLTDQARDMLCDLSQTHDQLTLRAARISLNPNTTLEDWQSLSEDYWQSL